MGVGGYGVALVGRAETLLALALLGENPTELESKHTRRSSDALGHSPFSTQTSTNTTIELMYLPSQVHAAAAEKSVPS